MFRFVFVYALLLASASWVAHVTATVAAATIITVAAVYPTALSTLYLRGQGCDGLSWIQGQQMTLIANPDGSSMWQYQLTYCDPNTVAEVKVLLGDMQWMLGANHHINATNLTDGVTTMFPWFNTFSGTLTIINNVYSAELNNYRDVIVYLPPSYNENTLKVHKNILIMHDGQNLFNPATSPYGVAWMCQDTMDKMIIGGNSDEVILVGAYNTNDRNDEYTYISDPSEGFGGKGNLYLDWIETTLLPLVGTRFRVHMERNTLGILGSSLGGLISCYAGWTRDVYGKVGCMSSSFWWDANDYQKHVITKGLPSTPFPQIYMDSGTQGGEANCTIYTTEIYNYQLSKGFISNVTAWQYVQQGGAHNEASWAKRFNEPIGALYPPNTV